MLSGSKTILSVTLATLACACGPLPVEEVEPTDAGVQLPTEDGGVEDAGLTPEDAGTLEEEDAGWVDPDAGEEPLDGGQEPTDAGTPPPGCPTSAPAPAPYTGVNNDPKFLQVYVNNIENLETPTDQCPGDWQDLFFYMKKHASPDVFLVQQISGQTQLDFLVQYMTQNLPGIFAGVIAEEQPKAMNSPCGPKKDYQTNAIIYRTGRLTPVGSKHVWQSYAKIDNACRRNFQARTRNVMQKFYDKVANKHVTVVSLHWSTFSGTAPDPACAELNAAEVAQKFKLAGYSADLLMWGGDTNEADRTASSSYKPWYAETNGDLGGKHGFRDVIYDLCDKQADVKACLDNNNTIANRIDYLFTRLGNGCRPLTHLQHTIGFPEADQAALQLDGSDDPANYSDHRAIRAVVHY